MKKIFYVSVLFLLFSFNHIYSIDTVSTKYLPLKVGNSWTYTAYESAHPEIFRIKKTITDTVSQNGKKYFKILEQRSMYYVNYTYLTRIDSNCGRLLEPGMGCEWNPNEILVDSLSSRMNDSCRKYCDPGIYDSFKCIDDTSIYINLGFNTPMKIFKDFHYESFSITKYAQNAGEVYSYYEGTSNHGYKNLIGCVINGIKYGDTTLIGINKISSNIPVSFSLYQNYPNPFNPSTKIKFDIGASLNPLLHEGTVILGIYDILGREITTLVNEHLKPGTYEIDWNADDYPSGVYFYNLKTTEFIKTKRMVLIK